jgi:hypothetical protein
VRGLSVPYRVLIVVSIGTFMVVLDSSIVNIALPKIAAVLTLLWRLGSRRARMPEPGGGAGREADAGVTGRAGDDEPEGGEQVTTGGRQAAAGGESRSTTGRRRGEWHSTR